MKAKLLQSLSDLEGAPPRFKEQSKNVHFGSELPSEDAVYFRGEPHGVRRNIK